MADLEFFWDPVCPWAWITSRWVAEVQRQRHYDIEWRFISLKIINEDLVADWYDADYKAGHMAGLRGLRVADQVRLDFDGAAVGRLYTELGQIIHVGQVDRSHLRQSTRQVIAAALAAAELPAGLVEQAENDEHDAYIRSETALAFERTGKGVGTPILTFKPGRDNEGSFFGPVISKTPRGDEAVKLWDAVELIATSSGLAELKRSNRARPQFD